MQKEFTRLEMLIGIEGLDKLANSRVAVFGVGGVGGFVCESLVRSGIGEIHIIDNDTIDITNINRQLIALNSTIGKLKVDVLEERLKDINKNVKVYKYPIFYLPDVQTDIPFKELDYIVDAIDTVSAKIDIILKAKEFNIPIISSMGCGNRLDPTKLIITDLYKTKNDPLAKVMRHEMKKRNVKKLTVIASNEIPIKASQKSENKRSFPGSFSPVPATAGLYIAAHIINNILKNS